MGDISKLITVDEFMNLSNCNNFGIQIRQLVASENEDIFTSDADEILYNGYYEDVRGAVHDMTLTGFNLVANRDFVTLILYVDTEVE